MNRSPFLPAIFMGALAATVAQAAPTVPAIDRTVPATAASAPDRTRCRGISGFLDDRDQAGRIVRSDPSGTAPELGRILPPAKGSDGYDPARAEFRIVGSKNGWLEVEGAAFDPALYGPNPPQMFTGRGWIAGGGVLVFVQSELGFARPTHTAPVLIDARPDNGMLEEFGPRRIVGCEGHWVLADFDPVWRSGSMVRRLAYRPEAVIKVRPHRLRAWVTGICNLQETSCDGISGNRPETSGRRD